MIVHMRAVIIILIGLVFVAPPVIADETTDLEAGIAAYRVKNFQATIEKVLPLAIEGNAEAQYIISTMYFNGDGFPEDQCLSVIWAEKAARQGHAYAAVAMGFAYQGSGGIKRDEEMAYRWMAYGHKQGHPDILDEVDFLARYITAEQRADIDEDLKTWNPLHLPAPEFFPISRKAFKPIDLRSQIRDLGLTACTIQ